MIYCRDCQSPYPIDKTPYRCIHCDGVYEFSNLPNFDHNLIEHRLPGIWRYRHTLSLEKDSPIISLGEGNTPLIWAKAFGKEVAFKLEFLNPTGSFKDRGTAPMISFLKSRNINEAVEDSSGNAGASFAAYAAFAGIKARIFVPSYASGPKKSQIESYGADIVNVSGPRSKAAEAVEAAAQDGLVYASHSYLPQGIFGYATVAYELFEQLGGVPGTVISPTGQGSLLLGIGVGFNALKHAGICKQLPVLVGVQAAACAPLWAAFNQETGKIEQMVFEGESLAEGVLTRNPLRSNSILKLVQDTHGCFVIVDEDRITLGRDQLGRRGLFVEPTSAIVWNGLEQVIGHVPEPIVTILTGSGLKSNSS
jgi:threonine synthase